MPATITATVDATAQRVGVTLAGFSGSSAMLYREQGSDRIPVRAAEPAPLQGGSAFVWDYEVPFNAPVRYVAASGGADVFSGFVTVAESRAWLRSPGLPQLDVPVVADRLPALTRQRPQTVLRPIGRKRPIVLTDVLQAEEGTVGIYAADAAEADRVLDLLDQTPVALLQLPGTRFGARYVAVGNVTETPLTGYADEDAVLFEFPFLVVDRPEGGVVGDPSNSYQTVLDVFASYDSVRRAEATYLDVVLGVASN